MFAVGGMPGAQGSVRAPWGGLEFVAFSRRYIGFMTTLTVTEARKNLSSWLKRAKAGGDIGIIDGNRIIALRPVDVVSADRVEIEAIAVSAVTQAKMDSVASAWKRRKT